MHDGPTERRGWAAAHIGPTGRPGNVEALGLAWPVWPTHGGERGWRSPSSSARCRGRNGRGGGYRRCGTTTRRGRAPARSGMDGSGLGAPDLAGVRTRTAGDQASGAHGCLLQGRERAGEERKEKGKGERGRRGRHWPAVEVAGASMLRRACWRRGDGAAGVDSLYPGRDRGGCGRPGARGRWAPRAPLGPGRAAGGGRRPGATWHHPIGCG